MLERGLLGIVVLGSLAGGCGGPSAQPTAPATAELTCPPGSHRVQGTCVGEVSCPTGTGWSDGACRPTAAAAPPAATTSAPSADACFFNINSIPVSQVHVDGVALGPTPRVRAPLSPGQHVVVFVAGQEKKTLTATCAAGETKTVAAKLDPGY
ncbi:MAG: hypothetical protein HOO96_35885 [Polyangiaceae bacterium]|nr:hypothetical protein [Polyangiaceae bacterium]